jgi:hypothetical protein
MDRLVPFYVAGGKSYSVRLDVEVDAGDYWLNPDQIALLAGLREWALTLISTNNEVDVYLGQVASSHQGAWRTIDSTLAAPQFVSHTELVPA